ncbi:MAG: 50S ribosomal protein L15 [Candidatus Caccosoma sp.]|nr:50S ribosomal protein L15 [Candidatus Caccosoma sp.]
MKLNELQYTKGSRRKEMRVGRGMGSKGKQCGRGMNGQTKHNGAGPHPGFEGGQLPLYRAIPKFGFTNFTRKEYAIVSVADLDAKFENGAVVTPVELKEAGLIKKELDGVKVLGGSKLTKKLTVRAAKFSASAKQAIEEAGGAIEVIE